MAGKRFQSFRKAIRLIKEIKRNSFKGIGNPEPLKHNLSGYWSRRITHEHRTVYKVEGSGGNQVLTIIHLSIYTPF
ncbi:Txe/YoeB family addiction module toxin [Pseudozobellia thermophila]|uniref:Txe/YoeB family addiction module toxin n=1 Tax=Pseudozobellia thermophila TaxID=192903 RepID=UPI00294FF2D7|nr:Txe/YoeB family addiction module toxin [Pseudozobellia thermophila]